MNDIQRIKKVVDWLIFQERIRSRRELAEEMGYTESSLSQILNERVPLSEKFIKKLSAIDANINEEWLCSGNGEMLKTSIVNNHGNVNTGTVGRDNINYSGADDLIDLLKKKDEQIDRLIGIIEKSK